MGLKELGRISPEERTILAQYMSEYPVRIGQLAKDLGVAIRVSSMPTGVSGQISREGDNYVIRVNRNEARERQRFTIGHELAHYLLHRNIIDSSPDGITDTVLYRSGAPERIEFEANRLAAEIVMPMHLIEKELSEKFGGLVTEATIEGLASSFEVSKAAMEIKLSTLVEA
ncbi:ImmA/IrrE family metallo-endopeptidase [Tabrizicola sp.]|uniref:ImmA/IrrE family metallo-endopeptidase n=1 Tax=Tabrizicola sp. TaxID=2005166 RepID=UPI0027350835|nr:ImmA/IrrE family metallo-endopeptidase [Tabrizicola sp.]MDP3196141.1 ImmA/IrrE family metallo-endopeptidase [Tabrizicola sp.]